MIPKFDENNYKWRISKIHDYYPIGENLMDLQKIQDMFTGRKVFLVRIKLLEPLYDGDKEKIHECSENIFNSIKKDLDDYGSYYFWENRGLITFFPGKLENCLKLSEHIINNIEVLNAEHNYSVETFYIKIIIDYIKINNYRKIKSFLINKISNNNRFDEIIISSDVFSMITSNKIKRKFMVIREIQSFYGYKRKRKQFPNRSYNEMVEFFIEKKLKPLDKIISEHEGKLEFIEIKGDSFEDINKKIDQYLPQIIPINSEKKIVGLKLIKKQISQAIKDLKIKFPRPEKVNIEGTLHNHVIQGDLEIKKIIGE